jgi:isoamyl acetate esterase
LKQVLPTREQREAQNLPRIRLLTIWLGTNDSVAPGNAQHVSPGDFYKEMSSIIALVRERSPETRIILITPGPIQTDRTNKSLYATKIPPKKFDRSNAQVEEYVKSVKELGTSENIPVVDVYESIWAAAGSRNEADLEPFYSDGLHFAAPGYKARSCIEVEGNYLSNSPF